MAPFFKQCHYDAFAGTKPDDDDNPIKQERLAVREQLLILDRQLGPFIQRNGWDLHRHRMKEHYCSSWHFVFIDGHPVVDRIGSMWLHYGKSPAQLDAIKNLTGYHYYGDNYENFYNAIYLHLCMQIWISSKTVRAWLIFTEKNYYDKEAFLKRLRKDASFAHNFYNATMALADQEYFYEIDGNRMDIVSGLNEDDFLTFVKGDRRGMYSGIAKEYQPTDSRIDENHIINEMKQCFKDLYPLYELMSYKIQNIQSKRNTGIQGLRDAWGC